MTKATSVTEGNATATTPRDIETLAAQYADLPIEALIKEDLLRQGIAFDADALDRAHGCKPKSYFIFSFDRIPVAEMAGGEDKRAPEEIALEGGPWGLRRTIVSVRLNPTSPYRVGVARRAPGVRPEPADGDADLVLQLGGTTLSNVRLPTPPAYYARALTGGRPLSEVAPCIEWGYLIYLTVFRLCQYFGRDEECRFCDMNGNFRQQRDAGRPYVAVKAVDEIVEAMAIVAEMDLDSRAYTITGGAVVDGLQGMSEGEFYARYAEAIESKFPGRWIGKMVTQALPRPDLERFRAAGVRVYHPNYEVWDAERFALICPGKARLIGRDTWIARIEQAAEVFGPAHVIPNFVAGVEMADPHGFRSVQEALASTGEGLDYFMGQGIVPRFTTWCPEPLSDLGSAQGPAPLEYHAGLLRLWRDTHRRYRLPVPPGYGAPGAGRAVFSVSAFMDVIDPETPVAPVMGFVRHLCFVLGIVVLLGWGADPALALKRAEKYLSTPEMAKMVYDDVTFGTADGLLLHGWFLPFQDQFGEAHREPKPTIILVTDGTDNMGSLLWHYYNFFRGAPWHVLMFDWRGMGTSAPWSADTTQVVIPEQLKDLKAAIQYAKERPEHDGEHLGVFAFGAGAAVALAAAAGGDDIQAVAVRGIYSTQSEFCARRRAAQPPVVCKPNSKWPTELEPIQAASRVKGAVLVVVGETDEVTPKETAQAIIERIPGPKQLWIAPKAGHEGFDAPEVIHIQPFTVKIHGFFGHYLGKE